MSEEIIGPYVFQTGAGHNVTVIKERGMDMINDFFLPEFKDVDVDDLWLQQDNATCHTAYKIIYLFMQTLV